MTDIINWDALEYQGRFIAPYFLYKTLRRKTGKYVSTFVNFNGYEREYRYKQRKIKKAFYAKIKPVEWLKDFQVCSDQIYISYTFYPPRNAKYDINNSVSIADKFFMDYLQEESYIENDNSNYVPYTPHGVMGSVDPDKQGYFDITVYKIKC